MNEISTLINHKSQCKIMVTWLMFNARPQATAPITMQHNSHVADVLYIVTCQTCCLQERCAAPPPAIMRAGDVAKAVPVRRMDLSPAVSVYETVGQAATIGSPPRSQRLPGESCFVSFVHNVFMGAESPHYTLIFKGFFLYTFLTPPTVKWKHLLYRPTV